MKAILRTLTLALAGLVAVTAFTLDATPISQPAEAQAAGVSDTCPSNIRITASSVRSQYDKIPPETNNRWTYVVNLSGPNVSPSYRGWTETNKATTSQQRLYSPYKRESFSVSYTQREIVGYTNVYKTIRVRVPPYSKAVYRYSYNPFTGRVTRTYAYSYPVYNYENRRVFDYRKPVYGDVRYRCSATATWSTAEKSIDVTHAQDFVISTSSKMSDGLWVITAEHKGDALSGRMNILVGSQNITFTFNNSRVSIPARYSPNVDSTALNATISGFNPYHQGQPEQRYGLNEVESTTTRFTHSLGGYTQSRYMGRSVTVRDINNVTISAPTINPGISSAKANYGNTRMKIVAPYAAAYQQAGLYMCRLNSANLDQGAANVTVRVSASDRSLIDTIWANTDFEFDAEETFAKNSWINSSAWVNSNYTYRTAWFAGDSKPLAAGKTITLYRGQYSSGFRDCFQSLTGIYLGSNMSGVRVYRTVDLTGGHPARISYLFNNASFQASSPYGTDVDTIISAIQCLPEARGVKGVDIYDGWQDTTTSGDYRAHFTGGAYNLIRDPIRASNISGNYDVGGQDSDIWVTGFSPATGRYAPGARNPGSSVQCDYAKQASQTRFSWERENPYLGTGQNPVYVGDTVSVIGAAATKVGDPGRRVLGNITIRLSGPGYSQTRSCANPCGIQTFPELTRSGTYTITASWGGDAGLNGSSSSQSFTVYKYDTDLSFDPMLNGQNEADFTSTKPIPIKRTHLKNTSINWIPTVPAGDMGSNTIRVTVQQLQRNGSWEDYSSTITNANCLMASNPCSSEIGAQILKQGQYRIQLEYVGNNKYNPSTSEWSNTFWVYEDFKCIGINNDDGVSMPVQWWEDGQILSEYEGNVLRSGNPMIINHPYVDGRDFTGIVRLDKIETSSYFMGTPLADGANVRLYEMPNLTASDITKMLQGELSPQLTEYDLKPNMPVQGRYIFDNVRTYNSWPLNDGGDYQTIVRVYDVSDILDPGLKMMQEVRVYGIYYMDGIRRTGSIACADEDAPQSGYLKFNKVTVVE